MGFSQRMGLKPSTKDIQINSIDNELRNGLWNIFKMNLLDKLSKNTFHGESEFTHYCAFLWHNYFKKTIDEIPRLHHECEKFIRDKFFKYSWDEVYDFIEFMFDVESSYFHLEGFIIDINSLLEKEFSGYRIIDRQFCPITNEIEINEIEEAIKQNTPSKGANIHLSNALAKLSDKKNPDYGNSIKESISALGTVIRILTGESTFGKGLNVLKSKGIEIDEQLKSSIEKIYIYTNNKESGIRHEIVGEYRSPDFDDAKLMLVVCSSYINYLLSKSKNIL